MPKAAVCFESDQPLEICDIEVESPHPGEVRVRMAASGLCHSDHSLIHGGIPLPLPVVPGHEGAGVVTEVGEGVSGLAPGDHIIVSATPRCGTCYFCVRGQPTLCEQSAAVLQGGMTDGTTRLRVGDRALHQFCFAGTFAEETVMPAISAVKVRDDIPFPVAALIGCAVMTGHGAARHTANVCDGDTVVVVGCGGVGLNVIQGLRATGAAQVVAVDLFGWKLDLARKFGATDTILAGGVDPIAQIMDRTDGRGADVVFEVIGNVDTMGQAIAMVRPGGQAIFVGVPRVDEVLSFAPTLGLVAGAKTFKGCAYGDGDVTVDFPAMVDMYMTGELLLDELISREIGLDEVNDGFQALEAGDVARTVIVFP